MVIRKLGFAVGLLAILAALACGCNRVSAALALASPVGIVSAYVAGFLKGVNSIQWVPQTRCYLDGQPIDCAAAPSEALPQASQ